MSLECIPVSSFIKREFVRKSKFGNMKKQIGFLWTQHNKVYHYGIKCSNIGLGPILMSVPWRHLAHRHSANRNQSRSFWNLIRFPFFINWLLKVRDRHATVPLPVVATCKLFIISSRKTVLQVSFKRRVSILFIWKVAYLGSEPGCRAKLLKW